MTTPEIQNALLLVAKCVRVTTGTNRLILLAVRRAKDEKGKVLATTLAEIEELAASTTRVILKEIEGERQKIDVLDSQRRTTEEETQDEQS